MKNADKFVVGGLVYDVLSPATFGDYMETIGSACINPDGYAENKLFLAYDDNVQKLFRATTAIANSELLIKDTNCEPTTMAEALANALSAGGVSYDNTDSGLTASNVQDAIDEVNGDVETVNSDLANEVETRAKLGAHNLLINNLTTQVLNAISVSVDSDGIVTLGGTSASATTELKICGSYTKDTSPFKIGRYVLSGNSATNAVLATAVYRKDNNAFVRNDVDSGSGATFTLSDNEYIQRVFIQVNSGNVASGKIYPMIRLATDTDPTYQPYAKTNRELTEELPFQTGNITFTGATATSGARNTAHRYGHVADFYMDFTVGNSAIAAWNTTWATFPSFMLKDNLSIMVEVRKPVAGTSEINTAYISKNGQAFSVGFALEANTRYIMQATFLTE